MINLIKRFIYWVMDLLESGYREEKPFLNEDEREQWAQEKHEVYDKLRKLP